jgi:DnaJ-class molecular chaperone
MNKVCPLCKGAKEIPAHNGVDGDEHQPCQVCGGEGEVDEQKKPDSPVVIYKYHGTWAAM